MYPGEIVAGGFCCWEDLGPLIERHRLQIPVRILGQILADDAPIRRSWFPELKLNVPASAVELVNNAIDQLF
jgi:hypothetical protein